MRSEIMLVRNAQKLCAALALGMTMAIVSPLKSVAAPLSWEITWDDLYPDNDVVFSFEGEDIDNNGIINSLNGEVLSFELAGLEELGGGAIDLESLYFDLFREELGFLQVSNDRFLLAREGAFRFSILNDFEDTYDKVSFSNPVATAVVAEPSSPDPAAPPQVIGTEIVATEMASVPEPSLILGFITVGGFMVGSRKKAKA
ncbi:MAG: PEP-CTERM sorting domain-containing protein [Cyanobacteria bacterium J007]|nr:MAG: PEP-CTERM sorting domain-containing protein [Cyanobacteria bacterium J007]